MMTASALASPRQPSVSASFSAGSGGVYCAGGDGCGASSDGGGGRGSGAAARGWVALQDRFYRRVDLCAAPRFPLPARELADALLAAAPAAGPVALVPDRGWGLTAGLIVCTAVGEPIARPMNAVRPADAAPARAVALGWTRGDILVIVYEDATIVRVALAPVALPHVSSELPQVTPAVPATASVAAATSSGDPSLKLRAPSAALDISPPVLAAPADERPQRVYDAVVLYEGQVVIRGVEGNIFCTGDDNVPHRLHGLFRPRDPRHPGGIGTNSAELAKGNEFDSDISSFDTTAVALIATALNGSSRTADVEVAVVGHDGSLAVVNINRAVPVATSDVHHSIALSPDGKFIAAVVSSGMVVVRNLGSLAEIVRVNIPQQFIHKSAESQSKLPVKLAWVGPDAVAVLYNDSLLLVGPRGQVAPIGLKTREVTGLHLTTERDGLRVTSAACVEFVQLVPDSIEAVWERRTSPSYKLFRAAAMRRIGSNLIQAFASQPEMYDRVSNRQEFPMAGEDAPGSSPLERYEAISELRKGNYLAAAAQGCIDAACLTWNISEQKFLLAAAVYGGRLRSMLSEEELRLSPSTLDLGSTAALQSRRMATSRAELNVATAIAIIRVLNTARSRNAGVPLTKPQLDAFGLKGLIARFSRYGMHDLALRTSAFCGIAPSGALAVWARACMVSPNGDDQVSEKIRSHFESTRRMYELLGETKPATQLPYIAAAESAFAANRVRCAEVLLSKELYPSSKVPLYLRMGQESHALASAVASSDHEVLMDAVDHVLKRKSVREMAHLLKTLPRTTCFSVTDLLVAHLKQLNEHAEARIVLTEVGRHREAALELVAEADALTDPKARIAALEKAAHVIGRAHHRRSTAFELNAVQHAISSSYDAADLEKRCELEPGTLRGASSTTLLSVAAGIRDPGRRRDALTRLRRDLKVPEQRFFWVVLEALASAEDLSAVEALSNSAGHGRPPPIGLMAFVDVCLRHGHENEATKYALRIADLRDRARALARCGRGKEAADIASKLKSQQLLEEVEALVARHMSQIHLSPVGANKSSAD